TYNRDRCRRTDDGRDQAPACLRQRLPPRRLGKNQDGQRCRGRRLELEPEAREQRYCHCDPEADRKRPGTDGKSRETKRELRCRRECRRRPNGKPYPGFICLLVFEACHISFRGVSTRVARLLLLSTNVRVFLQKNVPRRGDSRSRVGGLGLWIIVDGEMPKWTQLMS